MADFAHLCAQLDAATGLGALDAYRASLDDSTTTSSRVTCWLGRSACELRLRQ
ncbi:hypothetical protein ABZ923_41260 [Streptomyces sp. NPDC046881]|uniref:hypothetical protein n=1 Tax=Streptomyces sp. NPDC046881 TaxID=3155374 RepID=UPI0033D3F5B3